MKQSDRGLYDVNRRYDGDRPSDSPVMVELSDTFFLVAQQPEESECHKTNVAPGGSRGWGSS